MALLRARPPAPPNSEPVTRTLAELEAELRAIVEERASQTRWLAAADQAHSRLVEEGADDTVLDQHEAERRARSRAADRLAARERELQAQTTAHRERARQAVWVDLKQRYATEAAALIDRVREMQEQHDRVSALCSEAERAGFVLGAGFTMLPRPPAFPTDAAAQIETALRALSTRSPGPVVQGPKLFAVKLVRGWNNLNRGEVVGYPATFAHRLVDAGFAEWATGEIPPALTIQPEAGQDAQRVRMRAVA